MHLPGAEGTSTSTRSVRGADRPNRRLQPTAHERGLGGPQRLGVKTKGRNVSRTAGSRHSRRSASYPHPTFALARLLAERHLTGAGLLFLMRHSSTGASASGHRQDRHAGGALIAPAPPASQRAVGVGLGEGAAHLCSGWQILSRRGDIRDQASRCNEVPVAVGD